MPDPVSGIMAAVSIGGSAIKGSAAGKAANQQAASDAAAIAEQRRQFDQVQKLLSPYVQAGTPALQGMLDLVGIGKDWGGYLAQNPDVAQGAARAIQAGEFNTPEEYAQFHYDTYGRGEGRQAPGSGQAAAIAAQEASPFFQSLAQQGENAILQNASATGGLRGGNVQGALAQFRPQLLNQFIEQQYGRLGGLATMGQNSAAGVGSAGMNMATDIGKLLQSTGQARAGASLAQGKAWGDTFGELGGLLSGINFGGNNGGAPTDSSGSEIVVTRGRF